jgi:ketosteroid isomerase-like protein
VHEETVREIYVFLNEGRRREVMQRFAEDAVWEWPPGGPDAGVYRGHEEINRAAQRWGDSWDDFRLEPEEVIERGDEVFVMCRYLGTGRGSGVPIDSEIAHLWEFRGDRVARLRMFGEAEKARQRFLEE